MLVLAIDTSSTLGGVALVRVGASPWDAEVLSTASARVSNAHGESLLPLVEQVLRSASSTLDAVDLLACGIGPGSFTGTRIGVATAKGLAIGAKKPLRGVESFDALAAAARASVDETIAVAIDARKGEVYLALARVTVDDAARLGDPLHARPDVAWAKLDRGAPPAIAVGDGVGLVPELRGRAPRSIGLDSPRASCIAALAGARQTRAPLDELAVLEPFYVRPPDVTIPITQPGLPGRSRTEKSSF